MASIAPAVTPIAGLTDMVATGGTAVTVVSANPNGGFIVNPLSASDQGLSVAEPLFVNPRGAATLRARNQTFALQPGQSWLIIPGQTTPTSVNAASNGHTFSVISI